MDDPIFITSIGLLIFLLLVAFIGRPKIIYKPTSKWRRAFAGSLWAINAMLFGGVSDPVEKGKVVKMRKRDFDDESENEESSSNEL